ncbi:MAG: hypothetical protein PHU71_07500 [Candidatus Gracilibacteria bacterium]|nr:hypothetical protein [Candidatus Gracilibacteria bacterium]
MASLPVTTGAQTVSGQRAVGQSTIEPAYDDATGTLVFLLTPDKAPFPSKTPPVAVAPLYIPMYPTNSTVDPSTLNCQPGNCDHLQVVPFPAPGYQNGGSLCQQYGFPPDACALVAGHDHLVGIASTGGDFNVPWAVHLIIFTPQGFADLAINRHLTTLADLFGPNGVVTAGDALDILTPIVFNCSEVSETVYLNGIPLTFGDFRRRGRNYPRGPSAGRKGKRPPGGGRPFRQE